MNQSTRENLQKITMIDAQALIKEQYPEYNSYGLEYYAWPKVYGSTAGPFGGFGSSTVTLFTLEAWTDNEYSVVFCQGKVLAVRKDTVPFNVMKETIFRA